MANKDKAGSCCSMEKMRLMDALERCDFCSDNYEEFHNCYRKAARESGERARACIIG
ncbi:MAG: hypothetical protein GWO38_34235 [Phycisphaerae bacterium]|jgi:hypothetical protein|nr:hypothetical protein [Phycisphaerae bacterium]NIX32548.1 hypothetical protein [Phycisphaerae bacterium]